MFVQVRCQNPGHDGRRRAGRFFSNGQTYRMEVVQAEKDFRELDKAGEATGPGDMTKMNQEAFESIKADPCFSVLADVEGGVSQEVFDSTKARLAEAAGKISSLEVEVDRLKGEIAAKDKAITDMKAALAAAGVEVKAEAKESEGKPKGAKGK